MQSALSFNQIIGLSLSIIYLLIFSSWIYYFKKSLDIEKKQNLQKKIFARSICTRQAHLLLKKMSTLVAHNVSQDSVLELLYSASEDVFRELILIATRMYSYSFIVERNINRTSNLINREVFIIDNEKYVIEIGQGKSLISAEHVQEFSETVKSLDARGILIHRGTATFLARDMSSANEQIAIIEGVQTIDFLLGKSLQYDDKGKTSLVSQFQFYSKERANARLPVHYRRGMEYRVEDDYAA